MNTDFSAFSVIFCSGVPDYVEKMHSAARTMHEWEKSGKWRALDDLDYSMEQEYEKEEEEKLPM